MAAHKLTNAVLQQTVDALTEHGMASKACQALGISEGTFRHRVAQAALRGIVTGGVRRKTEFEYTQLPEAHESFEELVERRVKLFRKKQAYEDARKLIPVKVNLDGPIGIWHFGDPHVDDDGTDLGLPNF